MSSQPTEETTDWRIRPPTSTPDLRRREIADQMIATNHQVEGIETGTREWREAIWRLAGLQSAEEYDIWSAKADPRYADGSGTPVTTFAETQWSLYREYCQRIYDRIQERGY